MLEIKDVSKSFSKTLFQNISFTIEQGQRLSIMGPSGSGKTTLLRCICGLEDLDEGQIVLDGRDITYTLAEERGIGLIFQRPVLYPHLDVKGNLKLGSQDCDVSATLAEVDLIGFENRRVETLSGGEGQRIALARALLANPSVLLLDEPFSSLDEELSDKLLSDVRGLLKARNCPAILVTHNHDVAKKFADSVISIQ